MANITHRIGIKASLEKTYNALATAEGVSGWWTKDTSGVSLVGSTVNMQFNSPEGTELGNMQMKVMALELNKKVHWHCLTGPEEWIGTEMIFDLKQEGDYTIVLFAHRNWKEEVEFMAHCSMKWAIFLLSLKEFAETGMGKPAPNDFKIDNWN